MDKTQTKRRICHMICALLIVFLWGGRASAEPPDIKPSQQELSLLSCPQLRAPLYFCGEAVPLDDTDVRERLDRELLLTLGNRHQVILWLKRSGRYMPVIEDVLKRNGLPDDLKYLVIVESDLQPHAGSPKGAMGFWQFMDATGRNYGLVIEEGIDERKNIFTSTEAAVRYLKKLHADFRSWTLAAAAYNMGEEGLKAEMLVQEINDYYRLYLPLETQQYVPRIVVAKLILGDPARYGFNLTAGDVYPPLAFDRIELALDEDVPVLLVAQAAGSTFKIIKDLNPEIRGYYVARGRHSLLVPKGTGEGFQDRFAALHKQWLKRRKNHTYEVQKGDTLTSIAQHFRVPLPALLIWNRRDRRYAIHPGDRLVVYPPEEKSSCPETK